MRKILCFIILSAFLLLAACGEDNRRIQGFTCFELSEYLSSIDGLSQVPDGYTIQCGDKTILFSESLVSPSPNRNDDRLSCSVFDLNSVLMEKRFIKDQNGPDGYRYFDILSEMDPSVTYLGTTPNNFAYTLEKYGFESVPEWSEWIKYNIPAAIRSDPTKGRGMFNAFWYDPVSNNYTKGMYVRETGDSTDIYIVYQELSLFYGTAGYWAPYIVSEEMNDKLKSELGRKYDPEQYVRLSAEEAVRWFWGEYTEQLPQIFSRVKGDVFIHILDEDVSPLYYKIANSGLDDISVFAEDMKRIGIDFEHIKSYIIKATVPHDGSVKDIVWELIGKK